MRDCRKCGAPVDGVVCPVCGDGLPAGKVAEPSRAAQCALEARRRFVADVPSSLDLTPQQWYNVCKFYPTIAERSNRQLVPVGQNQPLDKMARAGFSIRANVRVRDAEADAERAAIQREAA